MSLNVLKRISSSIFLILISFYCIIQGKLLFNLLLILSFILSILEWNNMAFKRKYYFPGVILLLCSFYSLYKIRSDFDDYGLFILFYVLLISISSDIGGYIFGNFFKGPKLTKISPRKTYSGVFGAYFCSLLAIFIYLKYSTFTYLNFDLKIIFLTIFYSTISQLGDLTVSFFKRRSNIKDSGKLIPGHGGILDRIDSMIFMFPTVYIFNLL